MLVQITNNLFFQKIVKRRLGRHSSTTLAEQLKQEKAAGEKTAEKAAAEKAAESTEDKAGSAADKAA